MKKHFLAVIFAGFLVMGIGSFNQISSANLVYAQKNEEISEDSADYDDFDGIIPSADRKESSKETKELAKRIQQGRVGMGDIFMMIIKLIDLVTKLAGTIAVLILIYGGYQYMIGSVSDDKEGAKKTIKYAIMGLVVTFMAYLIVNMVKVQFLGF